MNIKRIIMMAAAGVVTFTASFVFVWFTKAPSAAVAEPAQAPEAQTAQAGLPGLPQIESGTLPEITDGRYASDRSATEKRLKTLIYEVREKVTEHNRKTQALALQEERVRLARDMLEKDIEQLKNLQVELTSAVAGLKRQQASLKKNLLSISATEKANLQQTATIYDKMDPVSATKILTNMCANNQTDDAVKIIHYMGKRTAAKLLAAICAVEPKLAAGLCQRLKRIKEDN